jgi:hypothetical protein
MEDVTFTLYKISHCGFYNELDEHQFVSVRQLCMGFVAWAATLDSIGDSSTYTSGEDDDFLGAYCLDVRQLGHSGYWLLSTWNELPSVEDGVQVVEMASKIGAANVSSVDIGGVNVPGYPAFFLIDATSGLVLNVRFEQRLNGSRQFQKYLAGYLRSASSWCVWNEDDEDELLGYAADDEIQEGVEPKFSTKLRRVAGHEDFIRTHVLNIRRIIRRASVSPRIEEEKTFLDSAFMITGLPVNNRLRADMPFQLEFKTRLTPEKLEQVIEHYHETNDGAWNDVGFAMAGDSQKIHWLSGALAREKASINVERLEGGMIDIDSLANYLEQQARQIIERINGD